MRVQSQGIPVSKANRIRPHDAPSQLSIVTYLLLLSILTTLIAPFAGATERVLGYVSVATGSGFGRAWDVQTDDVGNTYYSGFFRGSVDFDPGPEDFSFSSTGEDRLYISKLDPMGNFLWAKQFHGEFGLNRIELAVDEQGNVLAIGAFSGTVDFNPGAGLFQLTATASESAFVLSLDADGDFRWANELDVVSADDIATDDGGNVYVVGKFRDTVDFDPGPGTDIRDGGDGGLFVSKLDTAGQFQWALHLGEGAGNRSFQPPYIAVDDAGLLYVAGSFSGTLDFDPGPEVLTLSSNPTSSRDTNEAAFTLKLQANGDLVWARVLDEQKEIIVTSLAVDSSGSVYTTGYFQDTIDIDPNAGTVTLTSAGNLDAYVSKLDSAGQLLWARSLGGPESDIPSAIAVDASGAVHVTGTFMDTADLDPGPETALFTGAGYKSAFIVILDEAGLLEWAGTIGGSDQDEGNGIAVDPAGNSIVVGNFRLTSDLDPGPGVLNFTSGGDGDPYVLKIEPQYAPVAHDDAGETAANAILSIVSTPVSDSLLANDTDANMAAILVVSDFEETSTQGADVSVNTDGTFEYDPTDSVALRSLAQGESVEDQFSYTVSDGLDEATATVSITVHGVSPSADTIVPNTTGPTNAAAIDFAVTFSEEVVNFNDVSDMVVMNTGTLSTGVTVAGGPQTYTVSVTGVSGDGSIALAVNTESDVVNAFDVGLVSSVTSAEVIIDNTGPVITITDNSDATNVINCSDGGFSDPGATATDAVDGPVEVTASGSINSAIPGTYPITYRAVDSAGNESTTIRSVIVLDECSPTFEATLTRASEDLRAGFSDADSNGDNRLSLAEAQAALSSLTQAQFDALDSDRDGFLSTSELEARTESGGGCNFTGVKLQDLRTKIADAFLLALSVVTLLALRGRFSGVEK